MTADYGRWLGFYYQHVLSLYLYMFLKEDKYFLDHNKKHESLDIRNFAIRIEKFKQICLEKYWEDFPFCLEILVEWEEKCLDDITLISNNMENHLDNNIFIQVKTKWWTPKNITKNDGVYKAVKTFLNNINFQKNSQNILFFIFTNKPLSPELLKRLESKAPDLYIDFIEYLNKKSKIKWLDITLNKRIIIDILNLVDIKNNSLYLKNYSLDQLNELENTIKLLKILFNNLHIVHKIDDDILDLEVDTFYKEDRASTLIRRITKLCWKWIEIKRWTPEFERYKKYKHTYFHPKDWWRLISNIKSITKWKFI